MDKENTLKIITSIAENVTGKKISDVQFHTKFDEISNWTSINHAVIMARTEEEFNIEFDLDEMIEVNTLGEICDLVKRKLNS